MYIYSPSERARTLRLHTLFVAPAAELTRGSYPEEWLNADGTPRTIPVEFEFGRATVPSNLGAYLIARGHAQRTTLILPASAVAA